MSQELSERAERTMADLEAFAAWFKTSYFENLLARSIKQAVAESQSPYVDRAGAAARWRCSESEIDRAARDGVLTRFERCATPMFLKAEGDEAIRAGTWKRKQAA